MTKTNLNQEIIKMRVQVCKSLANPIRMQIIDALKESELTAGDLACTIDVAAATLSQHLSILRNVGIIQSRREAKFIYYSLSDPRIIEACSIMAEVLKDQLKDMGMLSKHLKEDLEK